MNVILQIGRSIRKNYNYNVFLYLRESYVYEGNGLPWILHGKCMSFPWSTCILSTGFWFVVGAILIVISKVQFNDKINKWSFSTFTVIGQTAACSISHVWPHTKIIIISILISIVTYLWLIIKPVRWFFARGLFYLWFDMRIFLNYLLV